LILEEANLEDITNLHAFRNLDFSKIRDIDDIGIGEMLEKNMKDESKVED